MYYFHLCLHRQLANIKEVQTAINSHDFVSKVLPHIARRSDAIVREVLAFLSLMLFNANRDVQVCLHKISVREYRWGNKKLTIQRNWQQRSHKTKKNKINTQHNMCWTLHKQTRIM